MFVILAAIVPTILLLILGNILRRREFLPAEFWPASDKLTYFILFPSLLITKVSQVDLSKVDFVQIVTFLLLYFFILSFVVWGIYRLTHSEPKQFSSIYQGVLRFNSYVYFAIIEAIWGQGALAMSALIAGFIIPMVNICCVASFSISSGHFSLLSTLKSIVKNPLIIGALLGFLVNVFPILMPTVLFDSMAILSKAALPLALLSVGAAIRIKMLFVDGSGFSKFALWLTTVARLLVVPAFAWGITYLLGISEDIRVILVIFAAVPTATSSYILSKQLKGDADMMAAIISLQTVSSILTLIIWLTILF